MAQELDQLSIDTFVGVALGDELLRRDGVNISDQDTTIAEARDNLEEI